MNQKLISTSKRPDIVKELAEFLIANGQPDIVHELVELFGSNEEGDLIDTREVAKIYKTTDNTVTLWRHKGIGPRYIKLSRRAVRYRRRDVLDHIKKSMIETEGDIKKKRRKENEQ